MSKKVLNKRSNQVVNGKAKLPIASELDYGEIAINYHDGVESISIKNDSGEVVTFATEENLNKTELKSDQEFSYRKTGVDWDAKAATIKSIKGNTLAWNNLVPEFDTWIGNYGSVGYTGSTVLYTVTTVKGETTQNFGSFGRNNLISGHKYYHSFNVKVDKDSTIYLGGDVFGNASRALNITGNTWYHYRNVCLGNWDGNANYYFALQNSDGGLAVGDKMYIQEPMMIDLTLMYGNKISGLSDNQILALIAKDFNDCYYPSNKGELISNDASGIETVGFNLWDEEWEVGTYDTTTGDKVNYSDCIRSVNAIPIMPSTVYYAAGTNFVVFYYDANGNYLFADYPGNSEFLTPSNCHYLRFRCSTDYGTTYNHDICINLSNPSKNGIYEPYTKSYLSLNLSPFKVKSPNIWNEKWENGGIDHYSGQDSESNTMCRNKGYISVLPSTIYYAYAGSVPTQSNFIVIEYDINKVFIRHISGGSANSEFTTSRNTKYIRFTWVGTSYNDDICINLSSQAFNGRYFPSGELTIDGGLKSVNDGYDEINGDKYIKRVGIKMPSDYTLHNTSSANYKSYRTTLSNFTCASDDVINPFFTRYQTFDSSTVDYEVMQVQSGSEPTDLTYFALSPSHDVEDFTFYYKLAVPEVYELVEPIQSVYMVDKDGTERAINPTHEDNTPSAPFRGDIQYGVSHGDIAMDTTKLAEKVSNIDTQLDGIETLLSLI